MIGVKAACGRAATQAVFPLVIDTLQVKHASLTDWDDEMLKDGTYD